MLIAYSYAYEYEYMSQVIAYEYEYMLIGTPIMLSKILENHKEIQIKGATLPCVSEAKNLGVTFDSSLKWDHHIEDVRKRCNGKLIALSYLRNVMSEKTC